MRKLVSLAAAAASVLAVGTAVAQRSEYVQAGTLTCDISGGVGFIIGSQKSLNCSFVPVVPGPPEFYAGVLSKLGIDIGATAGGVMVWAVYAPTSRAAGSLAGNYGGASAEATVGAGVGANVLSAVRICTTPLQPLSVQGQTGLNVAAGVSGIELRWVR